MVHFLAVAVFVLNVAESADGVNAHNTSFVTCAAKLFEDFRTDAELVVEAPLFDEPLSLVRGPSPPKSGHPWRWAPLRLAFLLNLGAPSSTLVFEVLGVWDHPWNSTALLYLVVGANARGVDEALYAPNVPVEVSPMCG